MTELAVQEVFVTRAALPLEGRVLRIALHRAAGWAVFGAVVVAAVVLGLLLRRWAWDQTEPIRYLKDIDNAYRQGTTALRIGYIDRYDEQESRPDPEGGFMDLDYGPGRLAVATLWTRWVRTQLPPALRGNNPWQLTPTGQQFYEYARGVHRQYELVKPLLMVNLVGEVLASAAMFFLVRTYTTGKPLHRRTIRENARGNTRGNALGLVAALFFWFDPALISNAHCWPQWDSWVIPFFLWAVVLGSWNWWFCSGFLIACGAMFKGQILFGAPVFLLWPMFQGRLPAVSRWVIGLLSATALVTAVWLVRIPGTNPTGRHFLPGSVNPHAVAWLIYLGLIFVTIPGVLWWPRQPLARIPLAILLAAIITWIIGTYANQTFSIIGLAVLSGVIWIVDDRSSTWTWHAKLPLAWAAVGLLVYPLFVLVNSWMVVTVVIAIAAMAALLANAPRRVLPYAAAGWMAGALLLCIPVFGASKGWFELGLMYGTHHYEKMSHGELENLAELLQQDWGWDDLMSPALTLPAGAAADHVAIFLTQIDPGVNLQPGGDINLPLKYVLVCVWLMAVVICAIAAAVHDRNRSPRFLIAIAAPWIVLFAVMTQMHQRYLLWGAGISAAAAVLSPGYALLHLFLSIVAASQELQSMIFDASTQSGHAEYMQTWFYQFIEGWHPGVGWAVLLTAGIFVYNAVKADKKETTQVP
jgi:hypothetical protein